jgi:BMFP domain-containing protein YqiC
MESTTSTGSQFGMIDLGHIDELARRLGSLVPPGLREGREELQQNFKSVLQSGLGRLDLVTREEFDVQRAVLLRTREQLETLQRTVAELEAQLASSAATPQAPGNPQA